MKSRTSLFNRTIILNLWQRYWVLFAGYGFILSLLVLVPLVNGFQSAGSIYRIPDYVSVYTLLNTSLDATVVLNFLAAPAFAAMLFSFLYTARHTGLMASLPVKRETVYVSVTTAAVLGILLVNVIALALALCVELLFGSVSFVGLGYLLLTAALSIFAFFGLAALCCMLTGNILAGPAVYLIFSFVAYVAENLVCILLSEIVFGYKNAYSISFRWLSPPVELMETFYFDGDILRDAMQNAIGISWSIHGLGTLAIYAAVGVALLALGLVLYKNRRMEAAGDTVAIEKLKPVFRLCMMVGGGLVFACGIRGLFYDIQFSPTGDAVFLAVLLIIGGALGYFIGKMLVSRTVRVFRTGWKVVGLYAVITALLVTAVECNLFGYETHVPDLQEIEAVHIQVYDGNGALLLSEPENVEAIVKLHKNILASKTFHEADLISIPATEPAGYYRTESMTLEYVLTDGSTVSRGYHLNYGPEEIRNPDSEIRLLERIMGTREAIFARNRIGEIPETTTISSVSINWIGAEDYKWHDYSDLAPSELHTLYFDCILPDILDGGMGQYSLILDKDWAQRTSTITLGLDIPLGVDSKGHPSSYIYLNFNVDTTARRTMAFLANLGINAATKYEDAVHSGEDYNDLGQYTVDENGDWYSPDDDLAYKYREASIGIIGGADGPTEVYVTEAEID